MCSCVTDEAENTVLSALDLPANSKQETGGLPSSTSPKEDPGQYDSSHIRPIPYTHRNPPGLLTGTVPTVPTASSRLMAVEENWRMADTATRREGFMLMTSLLLLCCWQGLDVGDRR